MKDLHVVRISLAVLSLLVSALAPVGPLAPPRLLAQEYLAPGRQQICGVAVGERRSHALAVEAGQWLEITVDQRGADVAVVLRDPDGEARMQADGPTHTVGKERLFWISERAGRFQLEIEVTDTVGRPACYDVELEEPRDVGVEDRDKMMALTAMKAVGGESAAETSALFETLAGRWRRIGHEEMEAEALLEASLGVRLTDRERHRSLLERSLGRGDAVQRAVARTELGNLYFNDLHDLEQAREHLLAVHPFWRDVRGAGLVRMQIAGYLGSLHGRLGEYATAFTFFDEALQLSRELDGSAWDARFYNNRGRIHYFLAQYDRAEQDLARALELLQEPRNQARAGSANAGFNRAIPLTLAAYVAVANGDLDLARERIDAALTLRGDDRRGLAVSRVARGWVEFHSGRLEEARAAYEAALGVFRELGESRNVALVEHKLGLLDEELGDTAGARERFAAALRVYREIDLHHGEAEALLGRARIERQVGELETARSTIEKALAIVERLRTRPSSFHLQAIYFASKLHFFDFYIDLLMELHRTRPEAGHAAAALAASEQARARSLLETLHGSGVDPRHGADRSLLDRESRLLRRLKSKLYQVERGVIPPASAREESRYLRHRYDEARRALIRQLPGGFGLGEPRLLGAAEIQDRLLDEETILLEYHLGAERSFLFVVTHAELHAFELPARRDIEAAARRVEQWLGQSMKRRYRGQLEDALAQLSDMILGPAGEVLAARRFMIVTDGVLQYVPFAALPLPGTGSRSGELPVRLVSRHEISYLPSASTLAALRQVRTLRRESGERLASAEIAVLADPVYNRADIASLDSGSAICGDSYRGPRFPPGESGLPRLPCTRREAQAIGRLSRGKKLVALDFAATRELATSRQLGEYRYLHFATHGQFDAQFPEKSSLVFSLLDPDREERNGYLYMPDVYQLEIAADLVVLSACKTALGERIRGEGLVGFTQGFMYAGAPRVLVSLWNVDDPATATLMERFYHHLLEEGKSAAAALREAQAHMLDNTSWSAPYFWAGFVLQGDIS